MIDLPSLKTLKNGESISLGEHAYVRRKSHHSWVLVDTQNPHRTRWGTAEQIQGDVGYYLTHGHLPTPDGHPW